MNIYKIIVDVIRWIKYEQTAEGDSTRFSKPHIALLQMQGLMQTKNCLKKGLVLLDVEENGYDNIINHIVKEWIHRGSASAILSSSILQILMAPKQHLGAIPGENYFVYFTNNFNGTYQSEEDFFSVDKFSSFIFLLC
ncbi:hypothetical protein DICVIV_11151 [Dictyocaulus viviparus]|uniref:Band 3 cytoplasmic domain-containing protein n=1 Tax=Dictyocaulus viviparus TaxID=29172 RepID=A0A0D8XGI2_DICVI|nr:hypothetical protein DICVIV_11151 [Dictyocaulus viviparus]